METPNKFLMTAAILTFIAALLHLGCIYFGATWYRFFGAGEQMALLAEQGSWQPTLITLFITLVLTVWAAYALSAADVIARLPLIKTALVIITSIYLFRGIAGFFLITNPMGRSAEFWLWSSIICLILGAFFLIGTKQVWHKL